MRRSFNSVCGFILIFSLFAHSGFTQVQYGCQLDFPYCDDYPDLKIAVHNGKTERIFKPECSKNPMVLRDSLFGQYATISLRLDGKYKYFGYYVTEKPSVINFYRVKKDSFKITLSNAKAVAEFADPFYKYCQREREAFSETAVQHEGFDYNIHVKNFRAFIHKMLSYVSEHSHQYFSYAVFRDMISQMMLPGQDSLFAVYLNFYNKTFDSNVKNSYEGRMLADRLNNQVKLHTMYAEAPDFSAFTIEGIRLTLREFHGKYIILNFWASWCGPCIKKFPLLKEIRKKYTTDQLEIIGVGMDEKLEILKKTISKHKLNWHQIHGNWPMLSKYSSANFLPQLYVIDRDGKMVYDLEHNELDWNQLTSLKSLLQKEISQ